MNRHYRAWVLCGALVAMVGCNSGSSGSSSDSAEDESPEQELPELTLSGTSHELAVRLSWTGADEVDVYFARDPECDWVSYGSCPGGGLITDVTGEKVDVEVEDGLASSRAHWFVIRTDDGRESEVVAGRPWRAVPNNNVIDMDLSGNTLYIGGRFDQLGAPLGGLGLFDHSGNLTDVLPWTDDRVYTTVPNEAGGLFVGGGFEHVGGHKRHYVAQIDQYGRVTDWAVDLEDDVYALVLSDDRLFIGGEFRTAEGNSQYENLAVVDVSDGSLDEDWSAEVDSYVHALELQGDLLFVGGRFGSVNGTSREGIVALDPETGATIETWQGHTDNTVYALVVTDSMVIVGGRFNKANDEDRAYLAAFDRDDGSLLKNWNAELDHEVNALALVGDRLYIGGRFDTVQGQDQQHVAALDATSGELIETWRPDVPERAESIDVHDGRVYLGLREKLDDGEYLLVLDEDTGDRIELPAFGLDARIEHVAVNDENILLGGRFKTGKAISGTANLAALDKDTGRTQAQWSAPVIDGRNNVIDSIAVADDKLFFGGEIEDIDGVSVSEIGQVDRHTGAFNADWTPELDGRVDVLHADGQRLYVGGVFSEINSVGRQRIAAFSTVSGELDTDWSPELDSRVFAIETGEGFVAVGGMFSSAESHDREKLAVFDWDGELMTAFPDYEADMLVRALMIEGSALYVGGTFRTLGGVDRFRTAAINLDNAERLPWHASLEPETTSTSASAYAIASDPHARYVGGRFNFESQGIELNHLGAFNRLSGAPIEWNPGIGSRVDAVIAGDDLVYVAGRFDQVAGHPARYLVVLEGVGYGPDAEVVW